MMLWNRKYQEFDLVVSSVTTKVKGVAQTNLSGIGEVVWDVVDYSGPAAQVGAPGLIIVDPSITGGGATKVFCFIIAEQKFLFCVDQRHCDPKSEAGKMPRGALPSCLLLISLSVGKLVLNCCSIYIPDSPERQIVSHGSGLHKRLLEPAQSWYWNFCLGAHTFSQHLHVFITPDGLIFIDSV